MSSQGSIRQRSRAPSTELQKARGSWKGSTKESGCRSVIVAYDSFWKKMPQEENKDKKDEKTCDENVAKARQEGRKQALEEMEGMIQNEEKK